MTVVGLLVAAGSGERLGAGRPKAFVECAGRSLLAWSVEALEQACDRVVVAVPPGFEEDAPRRVAGAHTRSGSVRAALRAAPDADVAVVHDAARPLLTPALVEDCVAALEEGWDGAVAAAPVRDTLKEARDRDGTVVRTLRREGLWAVQTPQAFRAERLRSALEVDEAVLAAASDDASLVEASGGSVRVVAASADNLKVTTPFDLRMAEALLLERAGAGGAGARHHRAPAGT